MSHKIILSPEQIIEITNFISNTYQCTSNDILTEYKNKFPINRNALYEGFGGKEELSKLLFHGQKDVTRKKLSIAITGKTLSDETKKKISTALKNIERTDQHIFSANKKREQTLIDRYGSVSNSYCIRKNKTAQTKFERYGDCRYNNQDKIAKTKLQRYGNKNYNNSVKIKETQFIKYGDYAFHNKEKVEKTMLERYGVVHNWKSSDLNLNGSIAKYKKYGSKESYYKHILEKGQETKLKIYGDMFYSNREKAKKTCISKYGVPYFLMTKECQEKSTSKETQMKKQNTMRLNGTIHSSQVEKNTLNFLKSIFPEENSVIKEYQDPRYSDENGYQFKCDLYVKPFDLFIELNIYPTHGTHAFDQNNFEDIKIVENLKNNPTPWNLTYLSVWTKRDVKKAKIAKDNKLNYLSLYPKDNINEVILYTINKLKEHN